MHSTASPTEVDAVADKIRALGFQPHKMPGAQRIAVAVTGNPGPVDPAHFQHLPGVVEAVSISKPWKLASRETHPHDTVISIKTPTARAQSKLGGGIFGIIAGPCAVEGREQTMAAARAVQGGRRAPSCAAAPTSRARRPTRSRAPSSTGSRSSPRRAPRPGCRW